MNTPTRTRMPQLDVLRFLALFLVIGRHFVICPPEISVVLNSITTVWFRVGWTGICLFFVLSGFLISGLLFRDYQRNERLDIKKFLIRRGLKIYPSFWLLILVTTIVTLIIKGKINRLGTLGELLFLQNYLANLWWHTWTIAIEEHFYLGLSILFLVLVTLGRYEKDPFAKIPKIFVFIALACLTMRVFTALYLPFNFEGNINATHLVIDSLFFGVLLSYLWHFRELGENAFLNRHKKLIALVGGLLFIPAFIFDLNKENIWLGVFGFTVFYFASGLLILSFLKIDFPENRFSKFIGTIGKYSYSIYLWNMPAFYWGGKVLIYLTGGINWWIFSVVYFAGTFILGIGTAKLIEYPVLKLRDKYFPSKARQTYLIDELKPLEVTS